VASLRLTPGDGRSLAASIGQLVAHCQSVAGLEIHFDVQGEPRTLNSQTELALYRVAQEGLTNVRKHAQATRIEVVLHYGSSKVYLRIADNGRGMAAAAQGFGLLGLRERVQALGGVVAIDSRPGQGVQLAVEIPA
jgi:signal transduction histidine kinase